MPARIKRVKIMTPVQGDDAWIVIERPTVGEMEDIYNKYKDLSAELSQDGIDYNIKARDELLLKFVKEWNWVDENGTPLPQIPSSPDIIRELLPSEVEALFECITQSDDSKKKA